MPTPAPTPSPETWGPDTAIVTGPSKRSNSTEASFTFCANATYPDVAFQCAFDGGPFADCPAATNVAGLTEGEHTIRVRAYWKADPRLAADATPAAYTWFVDLTPPEAPELLSAPPPLTTEDTATFTFEGAAATELLDCALDDEPYAPCESPRSYEALPEGERTFRLRARDGAGNTAVTTHVWRIDTTPPTTTISPVTPLTNAPEMVLAFRCDEDACAFECSVDDGAFTACESPATFIVEEEGAHLVAIRATDAIGHVELTPATTAWTLDRTPPDTLLVEGPEPVVTATIVLVSFSSEAGARFTCASSLDPRPLPCTSPFVVTGLVPGEHTITVTAIDAAGNADPTPLVVAFRHTDDYDGDGIPDEIELATGTSPRDADTDDDGLLDGTEDANGNGRVDEGETDPRKWDTDGDGLPDGLELGLTAPEGAGTDPERFRPDLDPTTTTDPLLADSDRGGVFDGYEDANRNGRVDEGETDPLDPGDDVDADGDGMDNETERRIGTDPFDADSDDDGIPDGVEGTNDTDRDGIIDALDPDSDNDGLNDGLEAGVTYETAPPGTDTRSPNFQADADPSTTTDPYRADTDGDGLPDGVEDADRNGRVDEGETDPTKADTDGDGVDDGAELQLGRNPLGPDDETAPVPEGGCASIGAGLVPLAGLWLLGRLARRRRR